jgi:carbon-monoxide dehydrogenase medium subunit
VKPAVFDYVRPASLDEAVEVYAEAGDDGRILAGGQSLVPMLNMRLAVPGVLVDVNRVPGLDTIAVDRGWVTIGALTRQRAVERSAAAVAACPLLGAALPWVGHAATRNRGTIGGSIAHADPAGELPVALVAAGGEVDVRGPDGERRVSAGELFAGFLATTLHPGEVVTATRWPVLLAGTGAAFLEAAPRHGDFAYALAAAVVTVEEGTVTAASVALGGAADRPVLSPGAALAVVGGGPGDADRCRAAADAVRGEVDPSGSLHAPAAYQRHMLGLLAGQALCDAAERAAGGGDRDA